MIEWRILGASVTGTAHLARGVECDDRHAAYPAPDTTAQAPIVLAVADGAGSRPLASAGAQVAVRAVRELAQRGDGPPHGRAWLREAFDAAWHEIWRRSEESQRPIDEYGTTLSVALIYAEAVYVGQIGDGVVVVGDRNGYRTLSPPDRFEYVNETELITDEPCPNLRLDGPLDGIRSIFLSTDGLRMKILSLADYQPFQPFFEDMAAFAAGHDADCADLVDFLTKLDDQTGDDKTLLLAVRLEAVPPGLREDSS
jgi:hypothetical protein